MLERAVSFVMKAKNDLPQKLWHPSHGKGFSFRAMRMTLGQVRPCVGSGKVMQSWEKGTRTGSDVPMYFALGV